MTTFVKTDLVLFSLIPSDNITTHLRRCAADLLGLFKGWASKEKPGHWFKTRIKDLAEYLGGLYGKTTVSKATKLLDELGVVKQDKHSKDRQVHTYYYKFQPQELERLLQNQPSQEQAEKSQVQVELSDAQAEASSLYTDPLITDPAFFDPPLNECVVEEEMSEEEIKSALAHLTEDEPPARSPSEEPAPEEPKKPDLAPFFARLRAIDVPLSGQIRELLSKQQSKQRLHNNITALEEEAAKNGLKNPIASCIAAIKRNWQPRMDAQTWWDAAAKNLGREQRDKLIQNVTRLATPEGRQEVFVIFKTGRILKLAEAYALDWDAIAAFGGGAP